MLIYTLFENYYFNKTSQLHKQYKKYKQSQQLQQTHGNSYSKLAFTMQYKYSKHTPQDRNADLHKKSIKQKQTKKHTQVRNAVEVLCHWTMTAGRPPTTTILYMYCTGGTECLSRTPGSTQRIVVVGGHLAVGAQCRALVAQTGFEFQQLPVFSFSSIFAS